MLVCSLASNKVLTCQRVTTGIDKTPLMTAANFLDSWFMLNFSPSFLYTLTVMYHVGICGASDLPALQPNTLLCLNSFSQLI